MKLISKLLITKLYVEWKEVYEKIMRKPGERLQLNQYSFIMKKRHISRESVSK